MRTMGGDFEVRQSQYSIVVTGPHGPTKILAKSLETDGVSFLVKPCQTKPPTN